MTDDLRESTPQMYRVPTFQQEIYKIYFQLQDLHYI